MTELLAASNQSSESTKSRGSWIPYLLLGLVANAAIWSTALAYLKFAPRTYSSEWTITLPGSGSSTNVTLPDMGAASSRVDSPFDGSSKRDPRENYKFIAASEPVRKAAAAQLNIPMGEVARPRIKIVDNSTLMMFDVRADSPEKARDQSLALYKAFQGKLTELRLEQTSQEKSGVQATLVDAQKKLELAQRRLSDYKARSGLAADAQLEQLSSNIEQLRQQKAQAIAQQQEADARLQELSARLKVSAPQAAEAFVLKEDPLLAQYKEDYSQATASLTVLSTKYGPNHPAVMRERRRQQSAQAALQTRSSSILGRPVEERTLAQLNLGDSNQGAARQELFHELVGVQAAKEGHQANARALDQQIAQLEKRLQTLGQYSSTLEGLRRDLQIAETVFSSTLAGLDIGKSDIFGAYPPVQLLTEPTIPNSAITPNKPFTLLGAAAGSLIVSIGFVLLGLRKPKTMKAEQVERVQREPILVRPESRSEVLDLSNNK